MLQSKNPMLCMFSALFSALFLTANLLSPATKAAAQRPKVTQKWEYATLSYREAVNGGAVGSSLSWRTAKKTYYAGFEEGQPLPFAKLNKELGGKEDSVSLGALLDRIGQDGWELATHAMTIAPKGTAMLLQTWTFKRRVQ
jgi:hypothetical protein